MAEKRSFRFYLIVLGLALLSLALLRVQAQTPPDTLPEHDGAACVTICPLPGEGHPSPPETVQPATSHAAAHNFPSLHPRSELPAPTLLANHYVPVTLHRVDQPVWGVVGIVPPAPPGVVAVRGARQRPRCGRGCRGDTGTAWRGKAYCSAV